jgi:hypothetical protein
MRPVVRQDACPPSHFPPPSSSARSVDLEPPDLLPPPLVRLRPLVLVPPPLSRTTIPPPTVGLPPPPRKLLYLESSTMLIVTPALNPNLDNRAAPSPLVLIHRRHTRHPHHRLHPWLCHHILFHLHRCHATYPLSPPPPILNLTCGGVVRVSVF